MLTVAVRFRPQTSDSHNIDPYDDEKKELVEDEAENKSNHNDDHENNPTLDVFGSPSNYIRINNEFNLYFDHVLDHQSFQDDVFTKSVRDKANDFLNGNNCCILTYGAKSSGKSVLSPIYI